MMYRVVDPDQFLSRLAAFRPEQNSATRVLALYSATIAVSREDVLNQALALGDKYSVGRDRFYEVMLQSYLFLGFPRMLIAAENLEKCSRYRPRESALRKITPEESTTWFEDGTALCRQVYGANFTPLKDRVESIAPEIFRWMIIEGYGKVLSRPGLDIIDREIAIVTCLAIENREKQLVSHLRGALNVGADLTLLRTVISDLGTAAGEGYYTALDILNGLDKSV